MLTSFTTRSSLLHLIYDLRLCENLTKRLIFRCLEAQTKKHFLTRVRDDYLVMDKIEIVPHASKATEHLWENQDIAISHKPRDNCYESPGARLQPRNSKDFSLSVWRIIYFLMRNTNKLPLNHKRVGINDGQFGRCLGEWKGRRVGLVGWFNLKIVSARVSLIVCEN